MENKQITYEIKNRKNKGGNMRGKRKIRPNYKRIIGALLVLIVLALAVVLGSKIVTNGSLFGNNIVEENLASKEEEIVKPKDINVNLVAIGDVMCHSQNFKTSYDSATKTYDFTPAFKNVEKYISKADIAIGNLETTFAGEARGYSGYPTFNTPSALGDALKTIGIDIVSTANNHCMDKGEKGLISTLDVLDETGLDHIGTSRSKEEQDKVLVKDINGMKIAFLSFTYGTNGIPVPKGKDYLVNLIGEDLILEQIQLAKDENVDVICASMHWGVEYVQKQNKEQEKWAEFLFKNGVDIIIGNHAHVIEPMEKRTVILDDGTEKECFVVYALGNFISAQTMAHTRSNAILDIQLTKNGETGKITIDSVDYTPVYVYDKGASVRYRYELIDMRSAIADYESGDKTKISASLYNTLKKELADVEKVLGKPIKNEETLDTTTDAIENE